MFTTISARNSTGAVASSFWRPARSPARLTEPFCWISWHGETIVLCTAVGVKSAKPGPGISSPRLTVNYQEKAFAAGKIPGGFSNAKAGRPRLRS